MSMRVDRGDLGFVPAAVKRPREQVEDQLRAAILDGRLTAGQRLAAETDLAAQFGVSRATIREALRSLAAQGLIAKTPGARGGTFVQEVGLSLSQTLQDSVAALLSAGAVGTDEVALVRAHLEIPAARLAALRRDEDHLRALRKVVAAESITTVADPQVPDLDLEFHTTIADASGSVLLAGLVAALHQVTQPVLRLALSPEVGRQAVRQHRALLRAIEDQDAEAAEAAAATHVEFLRRHPRDRGH